MTDALSLPAIAAERRLRLFRDPCYPIRGNNRDDYLELRGPGGTLYLNNTSSFWVDTTSGRAPRYAVLSPIKAWVSPGGREARFLFAAEQLDAVLLVLCPRKKWVPSPETTKVLAERLSVARSVLRSGTGQR